MDALYELPPNQSDLESQLYEIINSFPSASVLIAAITVLTADNPSKNSNLITIKCEYHKRRAIFLPEYVSDLRCEGALLAPYFLNVTP